MPGLGDLLRTRESQDGWLNFAPGTMTRLARFGAGNISHQSAVLSLLEKMNVVSGGLELLPTLRERVLY